MTYTFGLFLKILAISIPLLVCLSFSKPDYRISATTVDIRDSILFDLHPNWDYFDLHDSTAVKLIHHTPAFAPCGILATASVSIVVNKNNDTLRVIDLCNTDNAYTPGKTYTLLPATRPRFSVSLPIPFIDSENGTRTANKDYDFNTTVIKTTYASILKN